MDIQSIQQELLKQRLDGWLLFDFRRSNDLACDFLGIAKNELLTRRFFYWIPAKGEPIKIVHAVEIQALTSLPGQLITYRSWQDLEWSLGIVLKTMQRIAMEYSPRNAIPSMSKVDAGTIEMIREFGVEVVSSADLLQLHTSVLSEDQLKSHLFAADVLSQTFDKAWELIINNLDKITEFDVQQFILKEFEKQGCLSEDLPICAVNANSANPHYCPTKEQSTVIKKGDFVLLDLWCKQNIPHAVYADITRVGVAAYEPTSRQIEIFDIVKRARDAATQLVITHFTSRQPLRGCEVDRLCRSVIQKAGYGSHFIHRTGHSIHTSDHGNGAHIDNLETQDQRFLLPSTCFSIEPGIYLPGEFGVRLEYDVYIHQDGRVQITGGVQEKIACIPAVS